MEEYNITRYQLALDEEMWVDFELHDSYESLKETSPRDDVLDNHGILVRYMTIQTGRCMSLDIDTV